MIILQRVAQRQKARKMTRDKVITEEAKYNFFALIKRLGHPKVGLQKELGLDTSIYDHFLTKHCLKNVETQSLILILLDFGKCSRFLID